MASITKYQDKRTGVTKYKFRMYLGRDVHGKQIVKTKQGYLTRHDAELAMSKFQIELDQKGLKQFQSKSENKDITFGQCTEMWFEQYAKGVRDSTLKHTKDLFNGYVLVDLDDVKLKDITTKLLQYEEDTWHEIGGASYVKILPYVSRVLQYAIKQGYINDNPTTNVIRPKIRKKQSTIDYNYWERNELEKFLDVVRDSHDTRAYALFRMLAFTGIRSGEAAVLTWGDIHADKGYISISKTATYGQHGFMINEAKTKAGMRTAYVDDKTLDILDDWHKLQHKLLIFKDIPDKGDDQYVFMSFRTRRPEWTVTMRTWFNQYQKKAGLKHITLHGLRHTYATLAFEGGMNIKQVQIQLGHTNIQTTLEIYTAVTKKQQGEISDIYAKYVNF